MTGEPRIATRFDDGFPEQIMEPMKPMRPMPPMEKMAAETPWWPEDLGTPSISGSADDTRYAYFADKHRLVIREGGRVRTFDTGGRRITGFSARSGSALRFDTESGPEDVAALREV
jgi:hypothetical protein